MVVHGCVIEERCLIGIRAVVLSRAVVKKSSIVAAGSVVIENQRIDPYHLTAGVPAKIKKYSKKNLHMICLNPYKLILNPPVFIWESISIKNIIHPTGSTSFISSYIDFLKSKQIITCCSIRYRVVRSIGNSFKPAGSFLSLNAADCRCLFRLIKGCRAGAEFRSGEKVNSFDY
jgi:hypothetical protein